jgi:hypothetical protein
MIFPENTGVTCSTELKIKFTITIISVGPRTQYNNESWKFEFSNESESQQTNTNWIFFWDVKRQSLMVFSFQFATRQIESVRQPISLWNANFLPSDNMAGAVGDGLLLTDSANLLLNCGRFKFVFSRFTMSIPWWPPWLPAKSLGIFRLGSSRLEVNAHSGRTTATIGLRR